METATKSTVKAERNPEWEGSLRITGDRTLRLYRQLQEEQRSIPVDKYGLFFAFSKEQFETGYKGLVQRGLIADGDKVRSFGGGCYGTAAAFNRWAEEAEAIDRRIAAECDLLEVYYEEYNNYECCLDWDGDLRAVEKVISIFGADRVRAELTDDKRFRHWGNIDGIIAEMERDNQRSNPQTK